ncbi:MAG: flagellar filament capping protein FliD [Liquorilactobacillus ghanensis]|uniref:flagellar filament capping protein FliD n=1 Tax=Liquorilactobacillus ghanensis TaxID=399370 RepID=UPI0039E79EEE
MASLTTDGISATLGQYSGITANDIITLLQSSAAYQNETNAQNKISSIQTQENAWNAISTQLTLFSTKVKALQSDDTYLTKAATTTDSSIATISGTTAASQDTYDLKVDQLATSTSITGTRISTSSKTKLGLDGTLTLTSPDTDSDGKPLTFDIKLDSSDTLNTVATKINALTADSTDADGQTTQGSHIRASVVDNHLVLTSTTSGAKTISAGGDSSVVDGLGLGSGATTTSGQNAKFELDGMSIERDSNTITDVVDGTTFNLNKVSDSHVTLSLTNDTSKITSAVQDMVNSYNTLMSTISSDLSVGDPSQTNNTTGPLAGDNDLIQLQSSLSSLITNPNVAGSTMNASSVGISFVDKNGTLGVDTDKLQAAINNDPTAVKNFFYSAKTTASGLVTISSSGYSQGVLDLVNKYLSGVTGALTANKSIIQIKTDGYQSQIKDLNSQISDFENTLEMQKQQYIDTFTRLDQAMMEGQSQLSYFTSSSSTLNSSTNQS